MAYVRSGPNIAVRVESMARHVPSQAGNETSEDYETHFVRLLFINSLDQKFIKLQGLGFIA